MRGLRDLSITESFVAEVTPERPKSRKNSRPTRQQSQNWRGNYVKDPWMNRASVDPYLAARNLHNSLKSISEVLKPRLSQSLDLQGLTLPSPPKAPELSVNLVSFSFQSSELIHHDLCYDARLLQNPLPIHHKSSGLDAVVRSKVMESVGAWDFFAHVLRDIFCWANLMAMDSELTVAIGCQFGKHRSVSIVEELGKELMKRRFHVMITHTEITTQNSRELFSRSIAQSTAEDALAHTRDLISYTVAANTFSNIAT